MATPPDFTTGQVLTAAQMNAVGMWKMTPTSVVNGTIEANGDVTFSGQTTVSLNGCFTADFRNYKVNFVNLKITTSNQDFRMRLRASGTDATAANYSWGNINYDVVSTVFNQAGANGDTAVTMSRIGFGNFTDTTCDIYQPQVTEQTGANYQSMFSNGYFIYRAGGWLHTLANSYDGFTIFPVANTFSGRVSVYGYN